MALIARGVTASMVKERKPRVLIVGAGGIGVPAAWTIAESGSADLSILDPDAIELSNLPRQVLYCDADIGRPKAGTLRDRLCERFDEVAIESRVVALDASNSDSLIENHAVVIDATDNPLAKFEINDACLRARVPFVYAGVLGTSGQLMTVVPRVSACLRCVFDTAPELDEVATCRSAGIIGPVAGLIGVAAANEAIAIASDRAPEFGGSMMIYRAVKSSRVRRVPIPARAECGCGAAARSQNIAQSL